MVSGKEVDEAGVVHVPRSTVMVYIATLRPFYTGLT